MPNSSTRGRTTGGLGRKRHDGTLSREQIERFIERQLEWRRPVADRTGAADDRGAGEVPHNRDARPVRIRPAARTRRAGNLIYDTEQRGAEGMQPMP